MDTKHRVMTACYGATSYQFTDEELADLFIHTPHDLLHDAHVWEYYAKDLWDDLPQYIPPRHHAYIPKSGAVHAIAEKHNLTVIDLPLTKDI